MTDTINLIDISSIPNINHIDIITGALMLCVMEESTFDRALEACGGSKLELARRCNVSNQTIHKWKNGLTRLARHELGRVIASAETTR